MAVATTLAWCLAVGLVPPGGRVGSARRNCVAEALNSAWCLAARLGSARR